MKTLTLMEASELVAQIEETFGVDASAPAGGGMVMAAGPGAAGDAGAEAKTEFDLVITEVAADKRIACIKVVRSLSELGLKEAKDAVTNLPFTLMEGKKKEDCEAAQKTLEEAGAKSELK
jgi:large subunit ribosomal protein L7/L12